MSKQRRTKTSSNASKTMMKALRKELEDALERCKDRDSLAEEVEKLKEECEDREMLAKRLAEVQSTQEETNFNMKRLKQRLDAADEVMKVDPCTRQKSSITKLMDMTSPAKPPFPLGEDWGVLDTTMSTHRKDDVNISLRPSHRGLKSFMGLTHTFKVRMRGKSMEEIVQIASSELRDARDKLNESKETLKRTQAEHESVSIRCDAIRRSLTSMRVKWNRLKERKSIVENEVRDRTEHLYELRKQRKCRVDTLRRRRLCEKEEIDPYVAASCANISMLSEI